jgi:ribonuclease BN (tRNA processing enzyme)
MKIVHSSSYQKWIERFGPHTQHLFLGRREQEQQINELQHSVRLQSFLSSRLYNSKLFHLFGGGNNFMDHLSLTVDSNSSQEQLLPLTKFHLLPLKKQGLELPADFLANDRTELDLFLKESATEYPYLPELNLKIHSIRESNRNLKEEYEIICLGTGCAIPSKYRNVSSLLVYVPVSSSGILLDCGEGTWQQLLYLSPPSSAFSSQSNGNRALEWSKIIKMIWISHPHADHHLGLINIILQRKKCLLSAKAEEQQHEEFEPIIIIAPMIVYSFLKEVSKLYPDLDSAFVFIPVNYFDPTETCSTCNTTTDGGPVPPPISTSFGVSWKTMLPNNSEKIGEEIVKLPTTAGVVPSIDKDDHEVDEDDGIDNKMPKKRQKLSLEEYSEEFVTTNMKEFLEQQFQRVGITSLHNVPVIHCKQSYGIILKLFTSPSEDNKKLTKTIVYSGDTRPSDLLIFYGQKADLLIHEATFEDDKIQEAMNKKHTTINEAMEVGKAMNCAYLLLTHFSQRYHSVPKQLLYPKGSTSPVQYIEERKAQQLLNPIIAVDFLRFNNLDMEWLLFLAPGMAEIFARDEDEDENLGEPVQKQKKGKAGK